ncbi:hypothetical protein NDU88_011457 [Pleurodeles waltl]|uniref:Uncharacterized protein n=1 Tax=Pleurodeles waltl TaxID=8319 RepID=A0AAV7Q536_PLEWA|nr:hypothetical protein NDU88_011457 [Pleurodeles waltl]
MAHLDAQCVTKDQGGTSHAVFLTPCLAGAGSITGWVTFAKSETSHSGVPATNNISLQPEVLEDAVPDMMVGTENLAVSGLPVECAGDSPVDALLRAELVQGAWVLPVPGDE